MNTLYYINIKIKLLNNVLLNCNNKLITNYIIIEKNVKLLQRYPRPKSMYELKLDSVYSSWAWVKFGFREKKY